MFYLKENKSNLELSYLLLYAGASSISPSLQSQQTPNHTNRPSWPGSSTCCQSPSWDDQKLRRNFQLKAFLPAGKSNLRQWTIWILVGTTFSMSYSTQATSLYLWSARGRRQTAGISWFWNIWLVRGAHVLSNGMTLESCKPGKGRPCLLWQSDRSTWKVIWMVFSFPCLLCPSMNHFPLVGWVVESQKVWLQAHLFQHWEP